MILDKELKDWEIFQDNDWNKWLYLYWVFSSYESNFSEIENLIQEWIKENIRSLYKISILLKN